MPIVCRALGYPSSPRNFHSSRCHFQKYMKDGKHTVLLEREWLLPVVDTKVQLINVSFKDPIAGNSGNIGMTFDKLYFGLGDHSQLSTGLDNVEKCNKGVFSVIRDDLLHPLIGGNKMRKLDALVPFLKAHKVTDLVTCGGCQSAHAAAIAVACAEHGIKSHLLLRGEQLLVPTGYNLISEMYGHVTYIPRSEYANRTSILKTHAASVAGQCGSVMWLDDGESEMAPSEGIFVGDKTYQNKDVKDNEDSVCTMKKRVAVIKEGAGDALALLGLIRLVLFLSEMPIFCSSTKLRIVVDCGTGTTAIGLALGIALLGLPWDVVGIMLADTLEGYRRHATQLLMDFAKQFNHQQFLEHELPITWKQRQKVRKFGNIFPSEIGDCKLFARQTGILIDPIYSLAACETAIQLCLDDINGDEHIMMLHTGGTLGLFGLAQRYPSHFH